MSILFTGVAPRDEEEAVTQNKGSALGTIGGGLLAGAAGAGFGMVANHRLGKKDYSPLKLGLTAAPFGAFAGDVIGTYKANRQIRKKRLGMGQKEIDKDDVRQGQVPLTVFALGKQLN